MAHAGQPEQQQQEIVRAETGGALLRPVAPIADILAAQEQTTEVITKALKPGRDYGKVPGTDKEALFKAGAERICLAFGVAASYEIAEAEVDHDREVPYKRKEYNNAYQGDRSFKLVDDKTFGLYRYVVRCKLTSRKDGSLLGSADGACSTLESKYASRPRDCENTVLKMAEKRAFVAAVLNVFALSDRFTQDVEEKEKKEKEASDRSSNGDSKQTKAQAPLKEIDLAAVKPEDMDGAAASFWMRQALGLTDGEIGRFKGAATEAKKSWRDICRKVRADKRDDATLEDLMAEVEVIDTTAGDLN